MADFALARVVCALGAAAHSEVTHSCLMHGPQWLSYPLQSTCARPLQQQVHSDQITLTRGRYCVAGGLLARGERLAEGAESRSNTPSNASTRWDRPGCSQALLPRSLWVADFGAPMAACVKWPISASRSPLRGCQAPVEVFKQPHGPTVLPWLPSSGLACHLCLLALPSDLLPTPGPLGSVSCEIENASWLATWFALCGCCGQVSYGCKVRRLGGRAFFVSFFRFPACFCRHSTTHPVVFFGCVCVGGWARPRRGRNFPDQKSCGHSP
jgi:hypothetical protein